MLSDLSIYVHKTPFVVTRVIIEKNQQTKNPTQCYMYKNCLLSGQEVQINIDLEEDRSGRCGVNLRFFCLGNLSLHIFVLITLLLSHYVLLLSALEIAYL